MEPTIGKNCTIDKDVKFGVGVVVHDDSIIGSNVRVDDYAVIGKLPMRAALSATTRGETDLPPTEIGDGSIIGTHTILYRGSKIGKNVLVADLATVREDVTVGDKTIVGRGVTIENHVQVGSSCKIQ